MRTSLPPSEYVFPGLRPFAEDEAHLFFGRENQVDAMVDKLAETHFLTVVGASGSGKSSLVNCGLRPALHRGFMSKAGTAWRVAQFRPGGDPIGAMSRALARPGVLFSNYTSRGVSLDQLVNATLRMSSRGLIDIYKQAYPKGDVNLLVVADQFEELFRFKQLRSTKDASSIAAESLEFVNLLLQVREEVGVPVYVAITMRSDFLGDCSQFPGLPEAFNAGQYLVPRLARDERREAVKEPIAVGRAIISPVLLTRLVNDVGDDPDQLSILQHALNRTWAAWTHGGRGTPLELKHYENIGTMTRALDLHAEKAFAELQTDRQRAICEKVFKALTDKGTDARGVRRPTKLGTLCKIARAELDETIAVLDVFRKPSRSFIMPPVQEHEKPLGPNDVIDISHESLMRVWKRLNRWADEEAQSAQLYRRLAEAARLRDLGEGGELWRDEDLQPALKWREKNQPNPDWGKRHHSGFTTAMAFLDESAQAKDAFERKLRARNKLVRWFAVVAFVAFVVATGLGGIAGREAARARGEARRAELEAQRAESEAERADAAVVRLEADSARLENALALAATERDRARNAEADAIRQRREMAGLTMLLRGTLQGEELTEPERIQLLDYLWRELGEDTAGVDAINNRRIGTDQFGLTDPQIERAKRRASKSGN